MLSKPLLSWITSAATFAAFLPYILSILKGETKPRVVSWIIWSISTLMVFAGQWADGGGVGAWPTGLSGLITLGIVGLAYAKQGSLETTRLDKACFAIAILGVLAWFWTRTPLWTVLLMTSIDLVGFIPTFRHAYHHPHDENITFYMLMFMRNLLGIPALEHYSLTTLVFPIAMNIAMAILVPMVMIKRKVRVDFPNPATDA
ncbi:MAG: hypothetical protein AB7F28_05735 [Candidatus Margulisiibacteriota bacterium]